MATSDGERRPLLAEQQHVYTTIGSPEQPAPAREDSADGDTAGRRPDQMSRQNMRNLLVANVITFLLSAGGGLYGPCLDQYVYHRISGDKYSHTHLCNKSGLAHDHDNEAQKRSAHKLMQFALANSIPAIFVNVFIGAYSDYIGRRFLFTVAVFGYVCQFGLSAVVAFLKLDLDWFILSHVLNGCCGSFYAFLLAMNVYNADNTPRNKTRTLGLALLGAGGAVGTVIGVLGGGYLIKYGGYRYAFLTAGILAYLAFLVELLFLAETLPQQPGMRCPSPLKALKNVFGFYFLKSASFELDDDQAVDGHSGGQEESSYLPHREPTNTHHPANGPQVLVDRRPEYCLGITVFIFNLLPQLNSIDTLYIMNYPFCWGSKKIGIYFTLSQCMHHFLAPAVLKLMSKCMSDGVVSVVSIVSMGGGYLVLALASTDWMLFLSPVVGFMLSVSIYTIRSLMSQRAPAGKQGALFAGQAVVETLCGFIARTVFNLIYEHTVDWFRGTVYLTMDGITLLAIIFMGFYIRTIRRHRLQSSSFTIQVPQ